MPAAIEGHRKHSRASTHSLKTDSIEANWGRVMARRAKVQFFKCPSCDALYQVVKAEAGPETQYGERRCRVCGAPLTPRDGTFVLKYFLLRAARPSTGLSRRPLMRRPERSIERASQPADLILFLAQHLAGFQIDKVRPRAGGARK